LWSNAKARRPDGLVRSHTVDARLPPGNVDSMAPLLRRRPTDASSALTLARSPSTKQIAPTLKRSQSSTQLGRSPTPTGSRVNNLPPRLPTPPLVVNKSTGLSSHSPTDKKGSVVGDLYDQYANNSNQLYEQRQPVVQQQQQRSSPKPSPKPKPPSPPRELEEPPKPAPLPRAKVIAPVNPARGLSRGLSDAGRLYSKPQPLRRANTVANKPIPRTYEEEDGYGSAEHDEAPKHAANSLERIRVKLHYKDDVRGMVSCHG
jgi:hypothetical protein